MRDIPGEAENLTIDSKKLQRLELVFKRYVQLDGRPVLLIPGMASGEAVPTTTLPPADENLTMKFCQFAKLRVNLAFKSSEKCSQGE